MEHIQYFLFITQSRQDPFQKRMNKTRRKKALSLQGSGSVSQSAGCNGFSSPLWYGTPLVGTSSQRWHHWQRKCKKTYNHNQTEWHCLVETRLYRSVRPLERVYESFHPHYWGHLDHILQNKTPVTNSFRHSHYTNSTAVKERVHQQCGFLIYFL